MGLRIRHEELATRAFIEHLRRHPLPELLRRLLGAFRKPANPPKEDRPTLCLRRLSLHPTLLPLPCSAGTGGKMHDKSVKYSSF